MNRSQVKSAIESGKPFIIRTAEGKEFTIQHRDYIFLSPSGTFLQIVDDEDNIDTIPLLTMTSVRYPCDAGTRRLDEMPEFSKKACSIVGFFSCWN